MIGRSYIHHALHSIIREAEEGLKEDESHVDSKENVNNVELVNSNNIGSIPRPSRVSVSFDADSDSDDEVTLAYHDLTCTWHNLT
jgi:hypothetical protein